jgi:predicted metal-dependent hydrolase
MMNTEVIEVAGLSVELVRKPIKNLHIGVYPPAGHIRVAAPPAISTDAVRVAIVTRLGWIKRKQSEFAGQAREPERLFVSGETHYVFGKPCRLSVRASDRPVHRVYLEGTDRLVLMAPDLATPSQKGQWVSNWYRKNLKEKAGPKIAFWANRLCVPEPRWGIRLMVTKWGSCNPDRGRIWLNLDLAKKPLTALDYVILHEMAHFVSRHHDEAFMSLLDRHMPTWRQVRADLNRLPLSASVRKT